MKRGDHDDLEHILLSCPNRFQALLDRLRRSIEVGRGPSGSAYWKAVRQRARKQK